MNTKQWMTTLGIGIVATSFASCGGGGGGGGGDSTEDLAPKDLVVNNESEIQLTTNDENFTVWVYKGKKCQIVMRDGKRISGDYDYKKLSANRGSLSMEFNYGQGKWEKYKDVLLNFIDTRNGQILGGQRTTNTNPGTDVVGSFRYAPDGDR